MIYQDLHKDYSAIETPTWALLLAQSIRKSGYKTGIFDVNAERLNDEEALTRLKELNQDYCVSFSGQCVGLGTVNMSGGKIVIF